MECQDGEVCREVKVVVKKNVDLCKVEEFYEVEESVFLLDDCRKKGNRLVEKSLGRGRVLRRGCL